MSRLAVLGPAATALSSQWSSICPAAPADEPASAEVLDWDAQMRQHGRRVVVTLLARGIPIERAKELAQDAWMRVMQNHRAGKLRDLHLPGVVIAQADFLARDDRRRTSRRKERGMASAVAVDPDANPAPVDLEARLAARQQQGRGRPARRVRERAPGVLHDLRRRRSAGRRDRRRARAVGATRPPDRLRASSTVSSRAGGAIACCSTITAHPFMSSRPTSAASCPARSSATSRLMSPAAPRAPGNLRKRHPST
jgi:hypothetical protein